MAEVRNWQPGWMDKARWTAQGMLAPLFGGDAYVYGSSGMLRAGKK